MTDLQSELAAFYRDCGQRLAVCEAATAGPWNTQTCSWRVQTNYEGVGKYVADMSTHTSCERDADATFIAASRNQRPGEIRALVGSVRRWERMAEYLKIQAIGFRKSLGLKGNPDPENNPANIALREILTDWRAGQ